MNQQPSVMSALDFLIGHWHTTGEILATGETQASFIKGTDSYEWVLNGCFILHKADVMMGGKRMEVLELIGELDPASNRYTLRSFDSEGSFTTMEACWDEEGNLRIQGDQMRSTLSRIGSNTMSAQWERAEDNQHWQPWMHLQFSK